MFGISIDFHLFEVNYAILDKEYNYKSKGGRAFVLALILGLAGKHFGYIDWSIWTMLLMATAACLVWDAITFIIFKLRVKRALTRKWFVLKGVDGIEYLHAITEKGNYLLVSKSKHEAEDFILLKKQTSDLVANSTVNTLATQQILELLQTGEYIGAAFIEGDELVLHTLEN